MFRQLLHEPSHTYTYVLGDPGTGTAILIDPVLGMEDRDLQLLEELGLTLAWVVETHVHADHITAASNLRDRTGCKVAYPSTTAAVGADRYLDHGERLSSGAIELETRHTPGHTSDSACYVDHAAGRVFTGDTLLIRGCGRTDFQEGDARSLYRSVHEQLFSLPPSTQVYPAHDYKGHTSSTVAEEQAHNPRLGGGRSEDAFVDLMDALDLTYPKLIDVAVPANRRLGRPLDAWSELARAHSGARQVSVDWVRQHGSDVRLVDVREPHEYHGPLGHVPDAELVPLQTVEVAAKQWDPEAPVVLICRSGARSDRAAVALERRGFKRVASMTGGTQSWMDAPSGSCG